MLADRHPGAAAVLLERALALEPGKASILEALGQAYFNQGDHARPPIASRPSSKPTRWRTTRTSALACRRRGSGEMTAARRHLRMAVLLKPENEAYQRALSGSATPRRAYSGGGAPPALLARQPRLEQSEHGGLLGAQRVGAASRRLERARRGRRPGCRRGTSRADRGGRSTSGRPPACCPSWSATVLDGAARWPSCARPRHRSPGSSCERHRGRDRARPGAEVLGGERPRR